MVERPDEVRVTDWDDLVSRLRALSGTWIFRGQCDGRLALATTLERHTPADMTRGDAERQLLKEFKRRAHTYLPPHLVPGENARLEWLALMQHYGAPTRLLDFTESPYVAAYFAVEDAVVGAESCAVWALNCAWCFGEAGKLAVGKDPSLDDYLQKKNQEGKLDLHPDVLRGMVTFNRENLFKEAIAAVVSATPERLSERLSAQQGIFLLPLDVEQGFMDNMSAYSDHADNFIKFEFPNRHRGRALEELRLMNITRASLFPGLDGFAQSFRQYLLREPPGDKMMRMALAGLKRPNGQ